MKFSLFVDQRFSSSQGIPCLHSSVSGVLSSVRQWKKLSGKIGILMEDWVVVPNIFWEFSSLFVEVIQFEEPIFQRGCRKSEYLWMLVISRLAWIENFFEIMQNPPENHRIPKLVVFRSQNLAIQSRDAPLFGRVQWILGSSTSWCLSLNCWAYPQKRLLWRFGWNYYSNHFSGFLFSGKFWRKNAWSLDFKA